MAIIRILPAFNCPPDIPCGQVLTAEAWNEVTENNRWIHHAGTLAGSANGLVMSTGVANVPINATGAAFSNTFVNCHLDYRYDWGVISILFDMLVYPVTFQSNHTEVFQITIMRDGAEQLLATFVADLSLPPSQDYPNAIAVTSNPNIQRYIVFKLNSPIRPRPFESTRAHLKLSRIVENLAPPTVNFGVGTMYIQLKQFHGCPI